MKKDAVLNEGEREQPGTLLKKLRKAGAGEAELVTGPMLVDLKRRRRLQAFAASGNMPL